jgi:hypothetical protein
MWIDSLEHRWRLSVVRRDLPVRPRLECETLDPSGTHATKYAGIYRPTLPERTMTKRDFIICAPLQLVNHSNGVLALVQLALSIEKSGRSAYLCVNSNSDGREVVLSIDFDTYVPQSDAERHFIGAIRQAQEKFGFKMLKDFSQQRIDECYVVYPEVMLQNALHAKRVIRYFLNREGNLAIGHKINVGVDDFILAHSRIMHPNPHHVCFFAAINPLFHDENTHPTRLRKMDLLYIGKGAHYGLSGTLPNVVTITRTWPDTKEQLAILLRNCRVFYSGDACSSINVEALLCGAIPALLHNGPWTNEELDGTELGPFPRLHAGTPADEDFFATLEKQRTGYIDQLRKFQLGWDDSVAQLIDKVDAHFESR